LTLSHPYTIRECARVPLQDVLDCAGAAGYGQDAGGGGEGVDVLEYLRQHGVPDETCNPFTGKLDNKCNAEQRCRNCMMLQNDNLPHCFDVPNFVRYRVTDYGFLSGEAAMMTEIQARGYVKTENYTKMH